MVAIIPVFGNVTRRGLSHLKVEDILDRYGLHPVKRGFARSASSSRVRVGFCLRPGQDRSRKLTLRRRGSRRCLSRDPPGLRSLPTLLPAFRVSARGTGEPFCRCDGLGLPRESPGAGALFPCSPWSDSARVSLRSPRSESPAVGHRIITVLRSVRLLSGCCSSGVSAGAPPP